MDTRNIYKISLASILFCSVSNCLSDYSTIILPLGTSGINLDQRAFNPIPLDICRFRAKTMPQIKSKQQGVSNWQSQEGKRVNDKNSV